MIGEMRTEALVNGLGKQDLGNATLIALLALALAANNVSVRTNAPVSVHSIVAKIAEGGKLTSDLALIRSIAINLNSAVWVFSVG